MKFCLNEQTIRKFYSVFSQFPEIEEVVIYGSRAKGNYREGSDIHITLKGENVDDAIRKKVYWELDDLNTPYLIDLSVIDFLDSDSLIEHINRVGKTFYKNDEKGALIN